MKKTLLLSLVFLAQNAFATDLDITLTNYYLDNAPYNNAQITIDEGTSIANGSEQYNSVMMMRGAIENLAVTNNGELTSNNAANVYVQGPTRNIEITNNNSMVVSVQYENIFVESAGALSGDSLVSVTNSSNGDISSSGGNIYTVAYRDLNQETNEEVIYNYDFSLNNQGNIYSNSTFDNPNVLVYLNEDRTNDADIVNSGANAHIEHENQTSIHINDADNFTLNNEGNGAYIRSHYSAIDVDANSYQINNSAEISGSQGDSESSTISLIGASQDSSITNSGSIISNNARAAIQSSASGGDLVITNSGTISTEGNIAIYSTGFDNFTLNILEGSTINGEVYAAVNEGGSLNLNIKTAVNYNQYNNLINQIAGINNYQIKFDGNYDMTISGEDNFSGDIIVNNKELKINGSTDGDVFVNSGAKISGNGFMQNLTLASGAIIAPGNSIGTLNVASATYNAGTISNFEFNRSAIDKIISTGNMALNGELNLSLYQDSGDFVVSQNIVESTAGAVTGQFSSVNVENNYVANLEYGAQNVRATIASKINQNILDSEIYLQNNIVRLLQNNVSNEMQNSRNNNISSWIKIDGFRGERDNLENSKSFKTNGELVSAGFNVNNEGMNFSAAIFNSMARIDRSYSGKENISTSGLALAIGKKSGNFYNFAQIGGGIFSGNYSRQVLVNNQMQTASANSNGDMSYVSLGSIYNYNKNFGLKASATLQRFRQDDLREKNLTYGNLSLSENKTNTLNFEVSNFYQDELKFKNNLFEESFYKLEISAFHSQLQNAKTVTVSQGNLSYDLNAKYNQGFIFGAGAEFTGKIRENIFTTLKITRRQNHNFFENGLAANLKLEF